MINRCHHFVSNILDNQNVVTQSSVCNGAKENEY
jgi:hypothetical protein